MELYGEPWPEGNVKIKHLFSLKITSITSENNIVFVGAQYYRPLASGFSWKTANRKPKTANGKISRDHCLAVTFAVCNSRLNRPGRASSGK